ncbi:MAG: MTH1187 family thiamine-binding protein [Armatimonadota bacterium]
MTLVLAEFSVTPMTDDKITPFIDTAVQEIKKCGLNYQVGPVGTTIEGELDQVLDAIRMAHQAVLNKGVDRVVTEIRIDEKKGGLTMAEEVKDFQ